jgi:uncharacterized protein (TIGR02646 family)
MRKIHKSKQPPILAEIRERLYGKKLCPNKTNNNPDCGNWVLSLTPKTTTNNPSTAYEKYIDAEYISCCKYETPKVNPKEILQEALAKEQGYVCCYCMQAIPRGINNELVMRIEHFKPQSIFNHTNPPDLTVNYSNLLAACENTQEKGNSHLHHCDVSKGNIVAQHLQNPALGDNKIWYSNSGAIYSHDDGIKAEIGGIESKKGEVFDAGLLNLNEQTIKAQRKNAWVKVREQLCDELGLKWTGELNKKSPTHIFAIEQRIKRYSEMYKEKHEHEYKDKDGKNKKSTVTISKFLPFYGYVLWELEQLLAKIKQ